MQVTPQNIGAVVDRRLAEGETPEQAYAWLRSLGVPETPATEAVQKAHARSTVSGLRRAAMRKANLRLLVGVVLLVVGIAVTAYTYVQADAGDSYTVMYGAVVVGVLAMTQGLWARFRVQRLARKMVVDLA